MPLYRRIENGEELALSPVSYNRRDINRQIKGTPKGTSTRDLAQLTGDRTKAKNLSKTHRSFLINFERQVLFNCPRALIHNRQVRSNNRLSSCSGNPSFGGLVTGDYSVKRLDLRPKGIAHQQVHPVKEVTLYPDVGLWVDGELRDPRSNYRLTP